MPQLQKFYSKVQREETSMINYANNYSHLQNNDKFTDEKIHTKIGAGQIKSQKQKKKRSKSMQAKKEKENEKKPHVKKNKKLTTIEVSSSNVKNIYIPSAMTTQSNMISLRNKLNKF